jgi:hypothetical protein
VHAARHEFILHFDVDVIDSGEFPWTNYPGTGGLSLAEARDALRTFARQQNLAAFVVAGYNPELDADGSGARKLVDLLTDVLSVRLEPASAPAEGTADPAPSLPKTDAPSAESEPSASPAEEESISEPAGEADRTDSANSTEANEPGDASVS